MTTSPASSLEIVEAEKLGYPKPAKRGKGKKSTRQILEAHLEAICKQIVFWRDGVQCVEQTIDGGRCGGGVQWGHYIPRQQSRWLKYDLGNTYAQCRNHNNLHDKGAQTMGTWFSANFGVASALAMEASREEHRGEKQRTILELEEMLVRYDELYQNRYYVSLDLQAMIAAGYYGEIIQEVWRKK